MKKNNYLIHFFFLLSFIFSHKVTASDDLQEMSDDIFSISGFGSLFATHGENDDLGFYREFGNNPQSKSWALSTDSNLGIQITADPTPQLSATVQFVYKDYIDKSFENTVKWANIKYQPTSNIDLRVGRMGMDIHMLSEYRDVGFAYLWVRPITDFYALVIFDNFDGIDASYFYQLGSGNIQFKLFAGDTSAYLVEPNDGKVKNEGNVFGTSFLFENETWKIHASIVKETIDKITSKTLSSTLTALSQIPIAVWPDIRDIKDQLNGKNAKIYYYSLGFAYDNDIQIQSEISSIGIKGWDLVPSTYSAYISIAKPINNVTPYITLSAIKMKDDGYTVGSPLSSPPLAPIQALKLAATQTAIQSVFNAGLVEQTTLSLGMRWDIDSNIAFKAQWDHTKIKNKHSSLWFNNNYPTAKDSMDTFSMGFNFLF